MPHAINWFEIPASDFQRAKAFYSRVLGADLHTENMFGTEMAFLPGGEGVVSGAIACGSDYTPGTSGALVYLNANPDLTTMLGRVSAAGGTVIVPKTPISPEMGYFALFLDSEGNKIGLHSKT